MIKLISHLINKVQIRLQPGKRNERLERGQVLVIVTLSVIVLTAIVGLAVDTGLLYLNHGKLRRAVDAAALAATAQFREGYDTADLQKAALEFLILNGINDPTATVETCKTNPTDTVLCPQLLGKPARKFVRVHASSVVDLAFLSVIGIHQTTVTATAVSEAASMDVVFVIDASDSMTYVAPPGDPMRDPAQCNPGNECHPFREVKEAAKAFVERLYFPYDRVAIVTFDDGARPVVFSGEYNNGDGDYVAFSDNQAEIMAAINGLGVVDPGVCPPADGYGPCREYQRDALGNIIDADSDGFGDVYFGFDCPIFHTTGNPDTCGTTSIGKGLHTAGAEFSNEATFRQEALWVVILLTDGAANGPSTTCPNRTWTAPYCRDLSLSRHCPTADDTSCIAKGGVYLDNAFDADDYSRDMADFLAEDQDVLLFTIGLGDLVQTSVPRARKSDPTQKCSETPPDPVADCYGAGELVMQYAADIGRGHYYFAPTGAQLETIFLDIAQNLATRLTQ
jgi:hypothetical protein